MHHTGHDSPSLYILELLLKAKEEMSNIQTGGIEGTNMKEKKGSLEQLGLVMRSDPSQATKRVLLCTLKSVE